MTFKAYLENSEQEALAQRAITSLYYQKGYDPQTIATMPVEQLAQDIVALSLLPTASWPVNRFAAMLKSVARSLS